MTDVVLIAYAFPPDPVVGSLRAAKVAQAFRSAGHRVQVITARLPGESARLRVDEPGYKVHTVRAITNPRHALSWLQTRLQRSAKAATPWRGQAQGPTALPWWKRHLLSLLYLPDDYQGFIVPAAARAIDLIGSRTDLLYTTAPPFSDHLAGLAVKAVTRVRWAAEFRDPWVDNPHRPAHTRSVEADGLNRWFEDRCIRAADHVVTVTTGTQNLLRAKLPSAQRRKVIRALNGIDHLRPRASTRRPGPFRIVHTGSLYQDRDPGPFFRALATLQRKRGLTASDVQVDFIGPNHYYGGQSLHEITDRLGIGSLVRFIDLIPHAECQRVIAAADLLLLLAQKNPHQVANKLYEYLGARKPILAFGDADGDSLQMLAQVGGHFLVTEADPAAIESTLETALQAQPLVPTPESEALLLEWSATRQMAHLISSLGCAAPTDSPARRGSDLGASAIGMARV